MISTFLMVRINVNIIIIFIIIVKAKDKRHMYCSVYNTPPPSSLWTPNWSLKDNVQRSLFKSSRTNSAKKEPKLFNQHLGHYQLHDILHHHHCHQSSSVSSLYFNQVGENFSYSIFGIFKKFPLLAGVIVFRLFIEFPAND